MKNNRYLPACFLVAIVFSAISCKKLVEKPVSFVQPSDFFTTPSQIEAAFAASMNKVWDYWSGYGYGMGNFINDDQYGGGDLVIGNNHGSDLWNAHYGAIANLNAAIGAMKKGSLGAAPQQTIDQLTGQAKFIRAYNYFMLVRMSGDLPLITEDSEDPAVSKVSRAPVADVYALIVSDLTEAAAKLPRTWGSAPGRPTSGAAKAMLAKAYLTMATFPLNKPEYYAKAADFASQVIQEADYSLVTDITKVFSVETKYGPEMMWSLNSNYADINTDPQIYRPGILDGWGDQSIQPEWEQQYPETPRKAAYLLTTVNGVNYPQWDEGRPYICKFMYDSQDDYNNYASVMNMPVIRFADVLLIYAEAANMAGSGPSQEAVDAVNKVINRANGHAPVAAHPLLTTSMSQQAFDLAVIEERNQELCFEFDRWFDLIRKHLVKEKNIPSVQQNFTDADYLFPIPDVDVELGGLTQNPGY